MKRMLLVLTASAIIATLMATSAGAQTMFCEDPDGKVYECVPSEFANTGALNPPGNVVSSESVIVGGVIGGDYHSGIQLPFSET